MARALLILAALALAACGPTKIIPAAGSRLIVSSCFVSSRGVEIYRDAGSKCPTWAAVEERVLRVEERYGVALAGTRVYIVAAWIECGSDVGRAGCTVGDQITVAGGVYAMADMQHELTHRALAIRGESGGLREFDLDHPQWKQERNSPNAKQLGGDLF